MQFRQLLEQQWTQGSFLCIGLDSDPARIPPSVQGSGYFETVTRFNAAIVDATCDLVCAYKPNIAFYEAAGDQGLRALRETVHYIHSVAPSVPVILDAKRADIGTTNAGYVRGAFDYLDVDALTVHPYLGREALQPFLDREDKGIIVLARTSNPGAGEFQDLFTLTVDPSDKPEGTSAEEWLAFLGRDSMRLYERVAFEVATKWNSRGNCLLVVGATFPAEARAIRQRVGDIPFLIPGIGAQGGDLEAIVMATIDSRRWGMIVSSSRSVLFASQGADFADAARQEAKQLRSQIELVR